ncbi:hypothetical protein DH2020_025821 [Rehmannia glutinosa]|uniref:Retrotransposon Copia-like N-terminal domain-containing protein n=1 Tax=Rehmannia glutinosa TaxID=99300 RepID=A0ABR0VZK5_REHGL
METPKSGSEGTLSGTTSNSSSQNLQGVVVSPENQLVSLKLTDYNYLIWKQHVLTAVRGYGLENFINKEVQTTAKFQDGTSKTKLRSLNPLFLAWKRQDQLLASWLLSSLSENLLIMMVGMETSRTNQSIGNERFYTSFARKMQYKFAVSSIKKGTMPMRDYLNKVKSCCDILASAGQQISEEDQVLQILTGLGSEYHPLVIAATSRIEPCKLIEVYAMLLSYETRLEAANTTLINTDGSTHFVNFVAHSSPQKKAGYTSGIDGQANRDLTRITLPHLPLSLPQDPLTLRLSLFFPPLNVM